MALPCTCPNQESVCLATDQPVGEGGANMLTQVDDGNGGTCLYMSADPLTFPGYAPTEAWDPANRLWGDPNLATEPTPDFIHVDRECPEVLEVEKLPVWTGFLTFGALVTLPMLTQVKADSTFLRAVNPALTWADAPDRVIFNRRGIYRIDATCTSRSVANGGSAFQSFWQLNLDRQTGFIDREGIYRFADRAGTYTNTPLASAYSGPGERTSTHSWTGPMGEGEEIRPLMRAGGSANGDVRVEEFNMSVTFLGEADL